jgi:octaprenyl-diphosphate synthase
MYVQLNLKERCQKILEENGKNIADQASRILLADPLLKDLRPPLEFISKNWRDPLSPSILSLACKAVGGSPDETHDAALAISLIHLCFNVWDDIIDRAKHKAFKPTLFGKFGEGTTLIIGGLASAKAFSILNQMKADLMKKQEINKLVWELCTRMAQAEARNLRLRKNGNMSYIKKLSIIELETFDLQTCARIGAIFGNGSQNDIKHLANYGRFLGLILEFWNSFWKTTNLTVELSEKIRTKAYPFLLLWARDHSEKLRKKLDLINVKMIEPPDISEIVKYVLETNVIQYVTENIQEFAIKAKTELAGFAENEATKKLKFFVEAQPQIFIESISRMTTVII